jgi:alkaline phosphatase D
MPIRVPASLPSVDPVINPDFQIYRRLAFGDLLDLSVIDTRQYRDDQLTPEIPSLPGGVDDADRTILGVEQREWLLDGLKSSGALWRGIANQVQIHPIRLAGIPEPLAAQLRAVGSPLATTVGLNGDSWDGYAEDRRRLLACFRDHAPDSVVITGDIHSHWVADLTEDPGSPLSRTVATELVGTSITSSGLPAGTNAAVRAALLPTNPHIRFVEGERRGYALVELTRDVWRTSYRVIDSVDDPRSRVTTLASFEVTRGRPGARQVGGSLLPL